MRFQTTDKDGRYEIRLDAPGSYIVTVQRLGGMVSQNSIEFQRTVPEKEEATVDLELPVGGIAGHVYDPEGKPASGVRVSLSPDGPVRNGTLMGGHYSELRTREDGAYEVDWLSEGVYTVSAGGAFFGGMFGSESANARQVKSGLKLGKGDWMRGVDFRLKKAGQVAGSVHNSSGDPVKDAAIFVRDEQGRPLEHVSMIVTDGAGRFSYGGLEAGHYTVAARSSSEVTGEARAVTVREGEKSEVELRLDPGTILIVSLVGQNEELLDASISVFDGQGKQVNGLIALPELMEAFSKGGWSTSEQRVGPLPPGKYKIVATSADGKSVTKPVNLNGQAERRLVLHLDE